VLAQTGAACRPLARGQAWHSGGLGVLSRWPVRPIPLLPHLWHSGDVHSRCNSGGPHRLRVRPGTRQGRVEPSAAPAWSSAPRGDDANAAPKWPRDGGRVQRSRRPIAIEDQRRHPFDLRWCASPTFLCRQPAYHYELSTAAGTEASERPRAFKAVAGVRAESRIARDRRMCTRLGGRFVNALPAGRQARASAALQTVGEADQRISRCRR